MVNTNWNLVPAAAARLWRVEALSYHLTSLARFPGIRMTEPRVSRNPDNADEWRAFWNCVHAIPTLRVVELSQASTKALFSVDNIGLIHRGIVIRLGYVFCTLEEEDFEPIRQALQGKGLRIRLQVKLDETISRIAKELAFWRTVENFEGELERVSSGLCISVERF